MSSVNGLFENGAFDLLTPQIFSYLDPADIGNALKVNKYFNSMVELNEIWVEIASRSGIPLKQDISPKQQVVTYVKELKETVKSYGVKTLPLDIQILIQKTTPLSTKEIKLLDDFRKARDTLVVLEAMSSQSHLNLFTFQDYYRSADEVIQEAHKYSQMLKHQNYQPWLSSLKRLSLDSQKLSYLPPEIGLLTQLDDLNLSNNRLVDVSGLSCLKNLKRIVLDNNKITSFEELSCVSTLQTVVLRNNAITSTKGIEKLTNLETLILSENSIKKFDGLDRLTSLEFLDLSGCQLQALPSEIQNLNHLKKINLSNNQLNHLKDLESHTQLEVLTVNKNKIQDLSSVQKLTGLKVLYACDNGIQDISGIGNLIYLEHLVLENNSIQTLPTEIQNLVNLTLMSVKNNQLCAIPAEIGQLISLEYLILNKNNISTLPLSFGYLLQLSHLSLEGNQFKDFPKVITNLSSLSVLNIENNQLQAIPPEIGNLSKLTGLSICNNKLETLPIELAKLNLTSIRVKGNNIKEFPTELCLIWKAFIDFSIPLSAIYKKAVHDIKNFPYKEEVLYGTAGLIAAYNFISFASGYLGLVG